MDMIKRAVLFIGLLHVIATTAWAQGSPCVSPRADQVNAHVQATVTRSATGYDYLYSVENRHPAAQAIWAFAVQAFRTGAASITQLRPANWRAGGTIVETDFYDWATFQEITRLPAGASATGFGFTQADLPTIVTFLAWGYVPPLVFPRGEAPECANSNIIENSFKGTTVGPKPPPQPFVAIEFLNYLITLVHDSRQQGWIRKNEEYQELLQELRKAKRRLEANDPGGARRPLGEFLEEVREEACRTFQCGYDKALTSEAYALLFFNGQFLRAQLPRPPGDRADDRDEERDDD
jgi:hypothetical protein